MIDINRRQFLRITGMGLAGALLSPGKILAMTKKQRDYFSNDSDETLLARMIFGESRNLLDRRIDPDYRESIMIGWTAINRAERKIKGDNLKKVLLAPKQYSCFNPKDPNLRKLKHPEKYEPQKWYIALNLSEKILKGKLDYLNYDQDHYHKKDITPKWANSSRMEKVWGQPFFEHEFYRRS